MVNPPPPRAKQRVKAPTMPSHALCFPGVRGALARNLRYDLARDLLCCFLSVISIYCFPCLIEEGPSVDDIFDECIPIST